MKTKNIIALLLLAVIFSGCSSTGFMAARRKDAADIFTLTFGVGTGVKARVGPIMLAAEENSDLFGLRAGEFFADGNGLILNDEFYIPLPLYPILPLKENNTWQQKRTKAKRIEDYHVRDEQVFRDKQKDVKLPPRNPDHPELDKWQQKPSKWSHMFGEEGFSLGINSVSDKRNKNIIARSPFPLYAHSPKAPFYTQIEVMGGFLFSVRAGFNVGELLDFILGWGGIDIYQDDTW